MSGRYERTEARKETRAGHYQRSLTIKAGVGILQVPKLRHIPFEIVIVERYKRRSKSHSFYIRFLGQGHPVVCYNKVCQ